MKNLEFHERSNKNHENHRIPYENNENLQNLRIPLKNIENHENRKVPNDKH